jgi:hypothetical protein
MAGRLGAGAWFRFDGDVDADEFDGILPRLKMQLLLGLDVANFAAVILRAGIHYKTDNE